MSISEIIYYGCPICNAVYPTKEEAQACFNRGYPDTEDSTLPELHVGDKVQLSIPIVRMNNTRIASGTIVKLGRVSLAMLKQEPYLTMRSHPVQPHEPLAVVEFILEIARSNETPMLAEDGPIPTSEIVDVPVQVVKEQITYLARDLSTVRLVTLHPIVLKRDMFQETTVLSEELKQEYLTNQAYGSIPSGSDYNPMAIQPGQSAFNQSNPMGPGMQRPYNPPRTSPVGRSLEFNIHQPYSGPLRFSPMAGKPTPDDNLIAKFPTPDTFKSYPYRNRFSIEALLGYGFGFDSESSPDVSIKNKQLDVLFTHFMEHTGEQIKAGTGMDNRGLYKTLDRIPESQFKRIAVCLDEIFSSEEVSGRMAQLENDWVGMVGYKAKEFGYY